MRQFMITFTHVDGGWDRLTPAEQQRHNETLQDFMRALAEEKQSRLVFLRAPLRGACGPRT